MRDKERRYKMKVKVLIMALLLMLSFTACSVVKGAEVTPSQNAGQEEGDRSIEELQKECPEYFELNSFKGIEVYVWEMAEDSFRCGMLSGTNRNKTDEEIWDLATRSLSISEAKKILDHLKIDNSSFFVIPVVQPVSSYQYEINGAYAEKVKKAFGDTAVNVVIMGYIDSAKETEK